MNQDINSAWAAVAPILRKLRFYDVKSIVGLAQFDMKTLTDLTDNSVNSFGVKDNDEFVDGIERHFLDFPNDIKTRFLNIVIEEVLSGRYEFGRNYYIEQIRETLQYHLNRLSWQLIDNKLLSTDILDSSELEELDPAARDDLIKAATKFRDGDLSGAISSACAAVDSVTERVYQDKKLGEASKSQSFKERCDKSLKAVRVLEAIDSQLSDIQWIETDITQFKENLKKTVSQAAFVMQTLRSNMSDVHGTKPVIKPLVFDSIKWAQVIVRLLSEKYDD